MRRRGRVIVAKVDYKGVRIKGSLARWTKENPGKLYFDSMIEYECHAYMNRSKIKFTYQPETVLLYDYIITTEFKKNEIKEITQRPIKYTPDFYLDAYGTYIEVKGYADPLFKLRWKLFKLAGYKGFIVYSLDELKILLKQLETKTNDLY